MFNLFNKDLFKLRFLQCFLDKIIRKCFLGYLFFLTSCSSIVDFLYNNDDIEWQKPSIDIVNEKIKLFGGKSCINYGYEDENGNFSTCYKFQKAIERNLRAISYSSITNECENLDSASRWKYKEFLNGVYKAIEINPKRSGDFIVHLIYASPTLACLGLKIDTKRLNGNDIKYWAYASDDTTGFYPLKPGEEYIGQDPMHNFKDVRYYVGRIELSELIYPDEKFERDFRPIENPLLLSDGTLTELYFEQKNKGENHPETIRISYLLCFLKIYEAKNLPNLTKAFFDKIKSQTNGDLNIPAVCK